MAAIGTARGFIRDQGDATRDEIVRTFVPGKNYLLGYSAAGARCKLGGYETSRQWWWNQRVNRTESYTRCQDATS